MAQVGNCPFEFDFDFAMRHIKYDGRELLSDSPGCPQGWIWDINLINDRIEKPINTLAGAVP
ncbi:hypothetical protein AUK22_07205 [bacterium CG2_30_54_10]|nr:MAG: hypothetical protein AUK22_07205 [bacterium CG2_30_54_10]